VVTNDFVIYFNKGTQPWDFYSATACSKGNIEDGAVAGSSLAGKKLRKRTKALLTTIEEKHGEKLKDWSGAMYEMEGIDDELTDLLPDETKLEDS